MALLAVGALILAGCGGSSAFAGDQVLAERHITLSDGREITCVRYSGYNQGGLSCDWERAR